MARNRSAGDLPPIRKSLGQHFLSDPRILGRIADALELTPRDTVVEIGPGRGALTELLRLRAGRTIAIEYDRKLAQLLREKYADDQHVQIVEADVLEVTLGVLAPEGFKLVGNVPYYITTPILFHAMQPPRPERSVFLVQREVAERMSAHAGQREYGALSANLQALAVVESLFGVPAGAFHPPPKVDSAVVRIMPRATPLVSQSEERGYRQLVQAAFGMRRKQMRRVIREVCALSAEAADAILQRAAIDADSRPETVSPEQFARLLREMPD